MPPLQRHVATLLMLALQAGAALPARAAPDAKAQREITALLTFVGQSHCSFVRNGKSYGGEQAQGHLEDKFHYLLRRDQVNTAEDFIDRAATRSSLSGEPYQVICDGRQQTSAAWLNDELRRMRQREP
ncbi:DUF5329 domain-containing protein [Dyella telluris]|uniref:DUF5329 domain-containing protein n=1 Tax=Dyella telluris TaxID=2763498 RepID=A0A7G8Q8P0_9GAMM|nr:DUF5329 domain-containing protein [Dyella telluris]QNK03148.1 DUF5329 domain-containing protein [Dyella telluris]